MAAKFSIEAEWQKFEQAILPKTKKNVSQIQRDEMRMAFWAGAVCLFSGMMSAMEPGGPDAEPTAEDMKVMDDINLEIKNYAATLLTAVAKKHLADGKERA